MILNIYYNNIVKIGSTETGYLRPSIQLKNNIEITSGDGTKENPYIIAS